MGGELNMFGRMVHGYASPCVSVLVLFVASRSLDVTIGTQGNMLLPHDLHPTEKEVKGVASVQVSGSGTASSAVVEKERNKMLPGIGQRIVKPNYRKCQTLSFCDGVPVPVTGKNALLHPPPDDDYDVHRFRPSHLVASRSMCFDGSSEHRERELAGLTPPVPYKGPAPRPFVPKSVLYDRLTLRFDGYYMEDIPTWGYYGRRAVHPVKLCYYLEDDSITVTEPVTPNSGRPQGKLVYRHKVLKDPPPKTADTLSDGPEKPIYWHWKDLNVASDVVIFGRRYRLVSCNSWTREFLTSAGIQVNAPEDMPESNAGEGPQNFRTQSAPASENRVTQRNHPLKKFLEHDGQILRFGCIWDRRDECGIGPDDRLKPYVLRYYLVDDTVQISDAEFENNQRRGLYGSMRAQEAILLRRQKLPKEPRPILTSPADTADIIYYQPEDFLLGNAISVHGRRFILVETGDEFTRNFYRKLDIVDFTPIQLSSI